MIAVLRDWRTFLLIMAAGLVTGFLAWTASQPVPACHQSCIPPSYDGKARIQQAGP